MGSMNVRITHYVKGRHPFGQVGVAAEMSAVPRVGEIVLSPDLLHRYEVQRVEWVMEPREHGPAEALAFTMTAIVVIGENGDRKALLKEGWV
jgi:hypothetical protein